MKKYNLTIFYLTLLLCCAPLFTVWAQASNPIITPSTLPYGAPQFDKINVTDIRPAIEQGLAEYEKNLKHIRDISPRKATFDNVVCAMSLADSTLSKATSVLSYMRSNFSN